MGGLAAISLLPRAVNKGMALATQCPNCNTTFRVAADQLKLRGGIVRCGTCSQVFDGNAALVDLDAIAKRAAPASTVLPEAPSQPEPEAVVSTASAPPPLAIDGNGDLVAEEATPAQAEPSYVLDFDLSEDRFPEQDSEPVALTVPETDAEALPLSDTVTEAKDDGELSVADIDEDPLAAPAPDAAAPESDLEFGPLPLLRQSAASDDEETSFEPAPVLLVDEAETDEPEFVRLGREKEQAGRRRSLIMGIGCFILVLAMLAQTITSFGNVLVAKYPALKPAVVGLCGVLRCKVELPSQIDNLGIETSELQTLPNGNFVLTILLRNESGLTQTWPHIELELKDANDKPQLRRVFTPAQYLPPNVTPAKGFAARSEQVLKIYFELKQVRASGFHTGIFYP